MRYYFRFKFPLGVTHAASSNQEEAIDQLFRAIDRVHPAADVKEVPAADSVIILIFIDGGHTEVFKVAAPMTYCVEVAPEFES
jgi:hypothetical protein